MQPVSIYFFFYLNLIIAMLKNFPGQFQLESLRQTTSTKQQIQEAVSKATLKELKELVPDLPSATTK